jgi:hypothetical protein
MKDQCILQSAQMVFYCMLRLQQTSRTYLMAKKEHVYRIFTVNLLKN